MMRGMLIRVGIDMGVGGWLGPIFDDGTFEYIPVPEEASQSKPDDWPVYGTIPARRGGVLADFLPARLRTQIPHADPEFETLSYGDPTGKSLILKRLRPGDALFFHAGLRPWKTTRFPRRANYIIGYFIVDRVVDFADLDRDGSQHAREWAALRGNFHVWYRKEYDAFVVVGDKERSRLLHRAFPFTELRPDSVGRPTAAIRRDIEGIFHLRGFVQRSTPRIIPEEGVRNILGALREYE